MGGMRPPIVTPLSRGGHSHKGLSQVKGSQNIIFIMLYMFLSWTKGLTQVRSSAHEKRVLQQLALNVHVKPFKLYSLHYVYIYICFICIYEVGRLLSIIR